MRTKDGCGILLFKVSHNNNYSVYGFIVVEVVAICCEYRHSISV